MYLACALRTFQSTLPIQGETSTTFTLSLSAIFQSTLPIQGETFSEWKKGKSKPFQSTLPIQGETPSSQGCQHQVPISIHSPYTGRDIILSYIVWLLKHFNPLSLYRERLEKIGNRQGTVIFQSTLPIQGETAPIPAAFPMPEISIHSPYTGRDGGTAAGDHRKPISIHSPYTGRDSDAKAAA